MLDDVVRKVDSNPPKKGPGCLLGVGAKRSGKGSAIDYIGSVKVIGYMHRTVVTHRNFWDI
jgi:predicted transcriptional regulator with HTH domain